MLLFGGLFLAGVFLLALGIVPELRRHVQYLELLARRVFARSRSPQTNIVPSEKQLGIENHFFGGPRQVSLQLAASKPSLRRRGALPLAKAGGAFGLPVDVNGGESEASSYHDTEPDRGSAPVVAEPVFETVGPVVEQRAEVSSYHDAEPDRELPSVPESLSAVVEEQAAEVSSYHHTEPDRELLPVAESAFESVVRLSNKRPRFPVITTEPDAICCRSPRRSLNQRVRWSKKRPKSYRRVPHRHQSRLKLLHH
jgi:hypothetical protein